jgi:hypothetical protein
MHVSLLWLEGQRATPSNGRLSSAATRMESIRLTFDLSQLVFLPAPGPQCKAVSLFAITFRVTIRCSEIVRKTRETGQAPEQGCLGIPLVFLQRQRKPNRGLCRLTPSAEEIVENECRVSQSPGRSHRGGIGFS